MIEKDEYTTVDDSFTYEIDKIKNSRFIANVFMVNNRDCVGIALDKIKKKYHNARHNCFAYLIKQNNKIDFRSSDDGEPQGTAGKPILNCLEGSGLFNILVVVTRYFGGTKLGTGGLIKAYSEAAKEVLEKAPKQVVEIKKTLTFSYKYDYTNLVMSMLNQYEAQKQTEKYGDTIQLTITINKAFVSKFISEILERSNGRIEGVVIND